MSEQMDIYEILSITIAGDDKSIIESEKVEPQKKVIKCQFFCYPGF
ncbi:MAG: hypothetical protein HQK91_05240 [Nitrospirae bacterium]|nr:hypothetical protein [Nitrospirota bacterium]